MKIPDYIGTTADGSKLELPADAITQVNAILGKRGKGKSNLLAVMLESFWKRGQSFVVLDPPAAHWGIRYAAGEDGQPTGPSGIDVLIIGGEHGDIPIEHTNGREAAQIIVEGDISAVVDMKQMGFTARQTWCADFADELFRINKTPRHIAFEEAQNFLPQQLKFDEQKRVLYAMEKLVTEGRSSGLGSTIASQRPALVNKNVLTQTDNLYQLMLIAPQDIDQAEAWLEHHVDKTHLKAIVDDLPKLKAGECWVLSPEWLHTVTKLQARWRVTYHSGRTPKPGEKPVNVSKFTVGEAIEKLKKLFAAKQTERRQDVADLAEAKKRIRDLEKELRTKAVNNMQPKAAKAVVDERAIARAQKAASDQTRREYETALKSRDALIAQLKKTLSNISLTAAQTSQLVPAFARIPTTSQPKASGGEIQNKELASEPPRAGKPIRERPAVHHPRPGISRDRSEQNGDTAGDITAAHRRVLQALAEFEAMSVDQADPPMIASYLGVKAGTGGFKQYLRELKRAGLITEAGGGMLKLTDEGRGDVPEIAPPEDRNALFVRAEKCFGGTPARILRILDREGRPVAVDDVAAELGISPHTGGFKQYIRELRKGKMIEIGHDRALSLAEWIGALP